MLNYPYLLYAPGLDHAPLFTGLTGAPFVADLSFRNPHLSQIEVRDQRAFQRILDKQMRPDHTWGLAGYLERRDSLLRDCPQMVDEQRFFHLGLDIIVALGTPLHAPLDAVVAASGYEAGEGNYGGFVLLRHAADGFETFYSFYGHLNRRRLPPVGDRLKAGDVFAAIGDFDENGNWFYHTHLQIITPQGLDAGYAAKGYCSAADLSEINDLCPSPIPLFKR